MACARPAIAAALLAFVVGCAVGGPERASDIQNLNAITDDISAVSMTRSDVMWAHDPNTRSTIPRNYQTLDNE